MKEAIHLIVFIMKYLERTRRPALAKELCDVVVKQYIGEDNFEKLYAEMTAHDAGIEGRG